MSKKIRYSLLALGFLFFLIMAPIIVLYVRGISYDFSTKSFVQTGILAVESDPKNTDIFLNGKLKRTSSGDIKFLLPGDYEVALKKAGYNDWVKRLTVKVGQVTWANPQNNQVHLLLSSPPQKTLSQNVSNFFGTANNFLYLADGGVTINNKTYPLPKPVNNILTEDGSGKNFIFTDNNSSSTEATVLYFGSSDGKFIDLSGLFSSLTKMQFSDSGNFYALSGGVLYQIDPNSQTKTPIFENVEAFYWQGNNLYYIQRQSGGNLALLVTQQPFNQNQTLLNTLPEFTDGNLFVSSQKQIFLLADSTLYQDTGTMENIARNVTAATLTPENSDLSIFDSDEFDYFDTFAQSLIFVTRSSQALSNLDINSGIGYAFFLKNNQITAIELDSRGSQNEYTLYSGTNIEKFSVDSAGQNILVLDNGELKILRIR